MLWGLVSILIITGVLGKVFGINITMMSLLGYINGVVYNSYSPEYGSILSLIVLLGVYSHLTPTWVTQFMAYVVVMGLTVAIKNINTLQEWKS